MEYIEGQLVGAGDCMDTAKAIQSEKGLQEASLFTQSSHIQLLIPFVRQLFAQKKDGAASTTGANLLDGLTARRSARTPLSKTRSGDPKREFLIKIGIRCLFC